MLKIKFEENKLNVPVVKFTLGDGSVYKALIDTGSMISLIGKEFPVLQKDKRKIEIVTVNGTKKEKVNASVAEIYFGGETSFLIHGIQMDLKNVISDIDIDMILGAESLFQMQAVVDFDNKELILN